MENADQNVLQDTSTWYKYESVDIMNKFLQKRYLYFIVVWMMEDDNLSPHIKNQSQLGISI